MKRITFDTPDGPFIAVRDRYDEGYKAAVHRLELPDRVAILAERILLEQSRVPFDDGGEDSVGRNKFRRMRANELVAAAFDIAEAYVKEMTERGHIYKIPSPDEIEEALKDAENKN